MSWGKGIILVFILFVGGIGVMVYKSMSKNVDLVASNYYEKELKYQEQINKINNTNALAVPLKVTVNAESIELEYPPAVSHDITGEVAFYRPSDSKNDFKIPVKTDNDNKQVISTTSLRKGMWKLKVNWKSGGKDYFNEEKVMIQ
jgi:nitrogen fixation protein FixH